MYLSFSEYLSFGGTLEDLIFNELEVEAETIINFATFNRLKNDTELSSRVKYLTNRIIQLLYLQRQSTSLGHSNNGINDNITSQSNDGVSIAYNGMKASDMYEACNREIQKAIKLYLDGESNQAGKLLLYRGLYRGE